MQYTKLITAAAFMLVACGESSAAGQKEEIVAQCHEKLKAQENVCDCIGEKAQEDLSEDQRALLIAMLSEDDKTAASLRTSLPVNEVTATVMFMVNTPGRCAAGK